MANTLLLEIKPGGGIDSGVFPTAEPTAGPLWRQANNVWFRALGLTHVLGRQKLVNVIGREAHAMAQAFLSDDGDDQQNETRLYYEDLGIILTWSGEGTVGTVIGELDPEGDYDLEPYGTWLLATDNVSQVKIWKNDYDVTFTDIDTEEFSRAKIIKKLAQRAIVYSTDVLPAGMHYSAVSNPELWDPVDDDDNITGAGNQPFRNLDSEIICVADLAGGHAVYTEDKMLLVQYLGETLRFGTPQQPISGIGAVSKSSVVSQGSTNFGIFPGGIFITDGTTFKLLDEPAMRDWLREMVDWSRGDEVSGYWDRRLNCFVWSVPLYGGNRQGIAMDITGKFSFIDADFRCSMEEEIFPYPFVGQSNGIYSASITDTLLGTMEAGTHLLDAGDKEHYKAWDFALFEGTLSGTVRFGYTSEPDFDSVEWMPWQTLMHRVPLIPYESVYLAIQFNSDEAFKMTTVKIYGATAGLVI